MNTQQLEALTPARNAEFTASRLAEILMTGNSRALDSKVRVLLHAPGSIGSAPSVAVASAQYGFDWDSGTFQIVTAEKLTRLSPEDVEAIRFSASKGQSWHAYQSQKVLRERINALEDEVRRLSNLP